MARKRTTTATATINEGEKRMATAGIDVLSQDEIDALLASSRQRGEYDRQFISFLESGVPGVQVSLTEGPFQGKQPQSVKTGFDGAIARAKNTDKGDYSDEQRVQAKGVRTILNEEKVYLVNSNAGAAE